MDLWAPTATSGYPLLSTSRLREKEIPKPRKLEFICEAFNIWLGSKHFPGYDHISASLSCQTSLQAQKYIDHPASILLTRSPHCEVLLSVDVEVTELGHSCSKPSALWWRDERTMSCCWEMSYLALTVTLEYCS